MPLPPLLSEIQTVIEELAEQSEPGVERGRQADVRRDVDDLDVVAVHRDPERLEARIADRARHRQIVEHVVVRRRGRREGVDRRLFGRAGNGGLVAVAQLVLPPPWRSASPRGPDTRRRARV